MTREEEIKRLKLTDACGVDLCEALDMAIKALKLMDLLSGYCPKCGCKMYEIPTGADGGDEK